MRAKILRFQIIFQDLVEKIPCAFGLADNIITFSTFYAV